MSEPKMKMQLEDWLDDLCVRFIINLPKEDLESVARICFQVEEAQWFYEDFIRPLDPTLPSMSLRSFCLRIFQHCPLLSSFSVENHMRAFEEFLQYKTRVPVRGAILLNEAMDSTVLVKGWKKGASWSFPRGKINKDEDDLDCAIREVYEETGFDIKEAGLVPKDDEVKYIQISMREQQIRLYVFRNIPADTFFQPKTRKEISKIQWYKLSELPAFRKKGSGQQNDAAAASNANKFYMVAPFLVPLKKWVLQQKKNDALRTASSSQLAVQIPVEEPLTEDDIGAQTETVADVSQATPAIETLEGATLELQRLLRIKPPTQGLQMSPSTTSNPDKGNALMALLQKKVADSSSQSSQPTHPPQASIPHTPFDLTYTNPPEPQTPHHHHPTQILAQPNSQPPPDFPIHELPTQAMHHHGAPSTEMPDQNIQGARNIQSQHRPASYSNQGRIPPPMLPQPPYVRGHFNPGQPAPPLLHPQPLPPQVQQSLLTRGILPTPNLPETAGRGAPLPPQHGGPNQLAAHGHVNPTYQSQHGKAPPQLTSHAMSLLGAFKSDDRRQNPENRPPVGIGQDASGPGPGISHFAERTPHSQTGLQANLPAMQQPNPASQHPQQHTAIHGQMTHPNAPWPVQPVESRGPASKPAPPTDSHRSALLDMFKVRGTRSPLSNEIRKTSPAPGPTSPGYYNPASVVDAKGPTTVTNGTPSEVGPGVNLPFRPTQIMARPKQPETNRHQEYLASQGGTRPSPLGSGSASARGDMRSQARGGLSSPRDRSVLQQLDQDAKRSPRLGLGAQAVGLPYGHLLHQVPSPGYPGPQYQQPQPQPAAALLHQRQDSNPEQKQKLLSLFGAGSQPSPSLPADDRGKMREVLPLFENQLPQQVRSDTPRSRVASLASAGGGEMAHVPGSTPTSRRGSNTPISPADRNFLLSYLESASKGAR